MTNLADFREEYEFLDDRDERTRALIDLGKQLEPMADAIKTDASIVQGCQAKVWTYPTVNGDGTLHFLADSTSGLTKGVIALVLLIVQDRSPDEILKANIENELQPFGVERQLTSVRTSGLRAMIAKIRATAARYAG